MPKQLSKSYFEELVKTNDFYKYPTSVGGIEIFVKVRESDSELYRAYVFNGRKQRPHPIFEEHKSRFNGKIDDSIARASQKEYKKIEEREIAKLNRKEAQKNVSIGDIFCTSWGYDRTIVDFFQVVDRPTPATVELRRIAHHTIDLSYMSATIQPDKDNFIGESFTKRIDQYGSISNIDDMDHKGYKTSPDSKHHTSWD